MSWLHKAMDDFQRKAEAFGLRCRRETVGSFPATRMPIVHFEGDFPVGRIEGEYQPRIRRQPGGHGRPTNLQISGFMLNLRSPCPCNARVNVVARAQVSGFTRWINRRTAMKRLDCAADSEQELEIWCHDPKWTQKLLQDQQRVDWLRECVLSDLNYTIANLNWHPGRVELMLVGPREHLMQRFVTDANLVLHLAQRSASLPAPETAYVPSRLERWMKLPTRQLVFVFFVGGFVILGGLGLLFSGLLLLIAVLISG